LLKSPRFHAPLEFLSAGRVARWLDAMLSQQPILRQSMII